MHDRPTIRHSRGKEHPSRLSLSFARGGHNKTFLTHQFASYPFHVCKVLYEDPDLPAMGTLYMQSSAGGLYENDSHLIEVVGESGAQAHITTQASTIVHSMTCGTARQDLLILAQPHSLLEFIPDPQILFPGSTYEGHMHVRVACGAAAIVSDSFLTHDPFTRGGVPNRYSSEIRIEDDDGRPLAIDRVKILSEEFGNAAPGVMGSYAAYGTVLLISPCRTQSLCFDEMPGLRQDTGSLIAVSELPMCAGHVFRILAADGAQLKKATARCWSLSRQALVGHAPTARRK